VTIDSGKSVPAKPVRRRGTSFDDAPLPTEEFALGMPFRLGA
jgi:hypothetical protein